LWSNHPYNQDQAVIDRLFDASSENLMLFYEGKKESIYNPAVLNTFEAFDRSMRQKLPDIYKTSMSLNNMAEMINVTMHDGDMLWFELPKNEDLLLFVIGYIRINTGPDLLFRFVDPSLERSQITIFFADHTSDNLNRIRKAAYDFFADHPMKLDTGEFKLAGGRIGLEMAVNERMIESHSLIDGMVLGGICVMCTIFFRSLVAGLMLTLPLLISNARGYAYMATNNIGLTINTLPVAAVGAGVGVDFAIYIYSRCIEEFPHQNGWIDTIMMAVRTSGKAVVFTGLTTILAIVTWYFISAMRFQAQMGFFVSMLLLSNMILSVTLHPFMLYMFKPRFVTKQASHSWKA
ncbi:MAG: MMPL family transporter, partial [Nitrospirota bacterium]